MQAYWWSLKGFVLVSPKGDILNVHVHYLDVFFCYLYNLYLLKHLPLWSNSTDVVTTFQSVSIAICACWWDVSPPLLICQCHEPETINQYTWELTILPEGWRLWHWMMELTLDDGVDIGWWSWLWMMELTLDDGVDFGWWSWYWMMELTLDDGVTLLS